MEIEYASNSNKYKQGQNKTAQSVEQSRVKRTVTGVTTTVKKKEIGNIASIFISDDIHNVKDYLIKDVLVPTLKKAALGALDMILNGDASGYRKQTSEPKISYKKFYDDPRTPYYSEQPKPSAKRFDYDCIKFETRGDAELALNHMREILDAYKIITVQEFYEIARLEAPYTANRYGWTNLSTAYVDRYQDGYILKLPKAMSID